MAFDSSFLLTEKRAYNFLYHEKTTFMSTENELANELLTYKYESNTLIFCSVDMLNEISKVNVLENLSK